MCRSYLILRPKDKSDPDPKMATVLLHIWPLMLVVTVANLILLVLIAGLIGALIFPALLICFALDYAALRRFCKIGKGRGEVNDTTDNDPENPNESAGEDNDAEYFIAMAALSAIWLPSVVGHQPQRIFLVSGVASLVTKILVLAVAVTFAGSGLQPQVYERPFLLFCFNANSTHLQMKRNDADVKLCSFSDHEMSEGHCFGDRNLTKEKRILTALEQLEDNWLSKYNNAATLFPQIKLLKEEVAEDVESSDTLHQKIRICEDDKFEVTFRLSILSGLLVVVALAAYSIYKLDRIADYQVSQIEMIFCLTWTFTKFPTGALLRIQNRAGLHTEPTVQGDTSLTALRCNSREETGSLDRNIRCTESQGKVKPKSRRRQTHDETG